MESFLYQLASNGLALTIRITYVRIRTNWFHLAVCVNSGNATARLEAFTTFLRPTLLSLTNGIYLFYTVFCYFLLLLSLPWAIPPLSHAFLSSYASPQVEEKEKESPDSTTKTEREWLNPQIQSPSKSSHWGDLSSPFSGS